MPTEDLKAQYGGKTKEALNRAIRAECPGGADALDLLTLVHNAAQRRPDGDPIHEIHERVLDAVDAMEDAVRERWGLPPRPEREDLRRGGGRRRGA